MSTYRPERKDYFREYMRRRRGFGKPRKPHVWKLNPESRMRGGRKGCLAHARTAAAEFVQQSLIDLPPHLQAEFNAIMEAVRYERGMKWAAISWAHQ